MALGTHIDVILCQWIIQDVCNEYNGYSCKSTPAQNAVVDQMDIVRVEAVYLLVEENERNRQADWRRENT